MSGKVPTTVPGLCDSCFYDTVSSYEVTRLEWSQLPHTCPRCHNDGTRLITRYYTPKHGWRPVESIIGKPDPVSRRARTDAK